jgi:hypothetical protein
MKAKSVFLSGLAFILISAPLALAEKGGHKKGRSSSDNGVWFRGYWESGNQYRGREGPWLYGNGQGLPPGLAKRDRLPPGLEKHLWNHGSLPPGLQKKIDPYGWKNGKKNRGYDRS